MKQKIKVVEEIEPGKQPQSVSWTDNRIEFRGYQMMLCKKGEDRLYSVDGHIDIPANLVVIHRTVAVFEAPVDLDVARIDAFISPEEHLGLVDYLWHHFMPLAIGDDARFLIEKGGHC